MHSITDYLLIQMWMSVKMSITIAMINPTVPIHWEATFVHVLMDIMEMVEMSVQVSLLIFIYLYAFIIQALNFVRCK